MWTYDQSSGQMFDPSGKVLFAGYSGANSGKNNPSMQAAQDIGPIPQGLWHIGEMYNSPNTGPCTLMLTPDSSTNAFNRSGFRIHGDSIKNPGTASHGCIILPRFARIAINSSTDKLLKVIE